MDCGCSMQNRWDLQRSTDVVYVNILVAVWKTADATESMDGCCVWKTAENCCVCGKLLATTESMHADGDGSCVWKTADEGFFICCLGKCMISSVPVEKEHQYLAVKLFVAPFILQVLATCYTLASRIQLYQLTPVGMFT